MISALLSRSQVYVLQNHSATELIALMERALKTDVYLKTKNIRLVETGALIQISGGDARKLLNALELVIEQAGEQPELLITNQLVTDIIQANIVNYDKDGEMHYDIISAFIKSIRGSDPNGAIYWLARMIEGGEDPKFIARRLIISAAEDIGLANTNALIIANNTFDAIHKIGWPEGRIVLAQCVIYLATSPKGNASYMAINKAQDVVKETGNLSVPLHLRNAPTKLMKDLGYGDDYKYAHNYEGNFVQQEFLPENLSGLNFFSPGSSQREQEIWQLIINNWGDKYTK